MGDLNRVDAYFGLLILIFFNFSGAPALGSTVNNGTVSGTVRVQGNPGDVSGSDFVVFSNNCAKPAALEVPIRVLQENCAYNPYLSVAVAGQKIDIRNADRIFHNSFSVSPVRFDTGQQKSQASSMFTLSQPGVAKIYCRVHPDMEAVVLILRNSCFVRPSADGSFVLDGLPSGTVEMRLWSPRIKKVLSSRVRVGNKTSPLVFDVNGATLRPAPRKTTGCPADSTSD